MELRKASCAGQPNIASAAAVEDHYVLVAVDGNYGIHGRGDDSFQALLALAQLSLLRSNVGDVGDNRKGTLLAANNQSIR